MPPQQPPTPPRPPAATGLAFSPQSYPTPQSQYPYKNRAATDFDCCLCVALVPPNTREGFHCSRQQRPFTRTSLHNLLGTEGAARAFLDRGPPVAVLNSSIGLPRFRNMQHRRERPYRHQRATSAPRFRRITTYCHTSTEWLLLASPALLSSQTSRLPCQQPRKLRCESTIATAQLTCQPVQSVR